MKIRHAITSAIRTVPVYLSRHARRSHLMEEVLLLACGWRDVQNWKKPKTLAIQLKLSRCAEDEAHAVLSNHVKPAKHSKRKVLASIGEDMRTVSRNTELTTHSELVEYRVRLELSREYNVS